MLIDISDFLNKNSSSLHIANTKGNPVLNDKGRLKKKTVGDVEFDQACQIASYISPVPGGVGPLTVCMLIRNTVSCVKQ